MDQTEAQNKNSFQPKVDELHSSEFRGTGGGKPSADLDRLCQFRGSERESERVREYLEYIRHIHPNNSSNLGVLFHSKVDETAALELLHRAGNDVSKAKFLVTFPSLCRQLRVETYGADLAPDKLRPIFEKYVMMNSKLHSKNEVTHFEKVVEGIKTGSLDMSFKELSEVIMEARSNKYKVPFNVRKLFEDSFNGSREIEKMLEGSKKMEDLRILHRRLSGLFVRPRNFGQLEDFLEKGHRFSEEVEQLMTGESKSVKEMQSKMNSLKVLCLKTSMGDPIHQFKELWEKTRRLVDEIQQIVSPYNTKSNQRKSDFAKTRKTLKFFLVNRIQDPKIESLCSLVDETSRQINVARLFLEDDRPASASFIEKLVSSLKESKFDMRSHVQRVEQKAEFLEELHHVRQHWTNENSIADNLKRIQKLKKLRENDSPGQVEHFQESLLRLQKIR